MKYLSIVRHAKSDSATAEMADFNRQLTKKGRKDAKRVAQALSQLTPEPNFLVSSPAIRAKETSKILKDALERSLSVELQIYWDERIYEADTGLLLRTLQEIPPAANHVILVGHNPGMEGLVAGLAAGASSHQLAAMPPAGLAHLQLEIAHWQQCRWGCGQIHLLVTPKTLRKS